MSDKTSVANSSWLMITPTAGLLFLSIIFTVGSVFMQESLLLILMCLIFSIICSISFIVHAAAINKTLAAANKE